MQTMHEGLKPCQFRQVDAQGRILCHLIKGGDREVSVNLCRACPVAQINCQNLRAGLEKHVSTPITVRFATGRTEVWDDEPPTIDFKQAACAAKTMPIHSPRDCAGCPIRMPNVIPQTAIQIAHQAKQEAQLAQPPVIIAEHVAAAPVAKQASAPRATHARPAVQSVVTDSAATLDLIARAQATAARKAEQRKRKELEAAAREENAPAETKSKIILLKEWLSGQSNKRQGAFAAPTTKPDADGVSEIVYAPVAPAYHENSDYERCVGWTD